MIRQILGALAAAVTLNACAARGPYELSLRLPQGRVTNYWMTTDQTVRQVLPGQTVTVTQKSTTEYRFSVRQSTPDGAMDIEVVYEQITLESRSPTGELLFDSRDPEQSSSALRGMQSLIGQGFRILVDRRGRIRNILGLEAMLEKVRSSSAALTNPAFAATVERYFNPNTIEASLAGFFDFIPEMKVLPGDTWQTERSGGPGLAMRLRNTWKLREVRRGRALLDLSTTIVSEGSAAEGGLSGTQEGSVELELATGSLVSAFTRQRLRGSIVVRGLPVPMEITGSATIRATVQGSK
jgi:hypothetical protein